MILYPPLTNGSCHDVEVVEVVARRRRDYVVTLRYEHGIAIVERKRLVELAVLGVDPLQREALVGFDLVVVGLLEVPLARRVICVVFVGRVARPVAVRGQNLDHQEPLCPSVLHEDRTYLPLHVARATNLHLDVLGSYHHRVDAPPGRRRGDSNLQPRGGLYRVFRTWRQIDRTRRSIEHALPATYVPPLLIFCRHGACPRERDQAHLVAPCVPAHATARLESEHLESDVLPARGLGRDLDQGAVLVGLAIAGNEQIWHDEELLSRGTCVLSSCSARTPRGLRSRTPSRRPRRRAHPRRSRNRGLLRSGRRGCR